VITEETDGEERRLSSVLCPVITRGLNERTLRAESDNPSNTQTHPVPKHFITKYKGAVYIFLFQFPKIIDHYFSK